jgi:hypothetical protein
MRGIVGCGGGDDDDAGVCVAMGGFLAKWSPGTNIPVVKLMCTHVTSAEEPRWMPGLDDKNRVMKSCDPATDDGRPFPRVTFCTGFRYHTTRTLGIPEAFGARRFCALCSGAMRPVVVKREGQGACIHAAAAWRMWLFEVEAVKRGCVAKSFYPFDFNSHHLQVPTCPHDRLMFMVDCVINAAVPVAAKSI